ncbi:ABC transporter substrate-binding protein [Paucihalobacter sp.]|uniref:ABC transporter substrate-binding protein n=1 Tax=Paucihalobacter sp. TaxID=2850405 RepID=UPI002FE0A52E
MTKKQTFSRIISLVPSQTELLVDLGLQSSMVGVTKFCVHPENLRMEIPVVGGTKQVNFKKIKALNPDIILCNKEENTLDMVQQLQDIAKVEIRDVNTFDDALTLIKFYGDLFNVKYLSQAIIDKIEADRYTFRKRFINVSRVKVAYFIWQQPYMVAANNTFINARIEEVGFSNVFKSKNRYPEIDLVDQDLHKTEIILLSSEPFPFKTEHVKQFKALFPDKQVIIADGEMFSWYGSRLQGAFKYFESLHETLNSV